MDVLMQNLRVFATAVLSFLDLGGVVPTLSVGYEWDWTTDRGTGGPPVLATSTQFRFGFEL